MNNETALERLSKISTIAKSIEYIDNTTYEDILIDIQEVVALAKANQAPSIDMRRFEAAKSFLAAIMGRDDTTDINRTHLEMAIKAADGFILQLQKPNP